MHDGKSSAESCRAAGVADERAAAASSQWAEARDSDKAETGPAAADRVRSQEKLHCNQHLFHQL